MITRSDFGKDQYLMLQNVSGIRSIYDTATREDLDISELKSGIMGNFAEEGRFALYGLNAQVDELGGQFRVSDMYRDWMMQLQANHDFLSGKKLAYSPPPGFSCHQAGRSIDFDIALIQETLNPTGHGKSGFDLFWEMSRDLGFTGVRENRVKPDRKALEAWHIDYMGSFEALYKKQGYKAMAQAAIMDAIGNNYSGYTPEHVKNVRIQAYLLHLGFYKYAVDGKWGKGSESALLEYNKQEQEKSAILEKLLKHYKIKRNLRKQLPKLPSRFRS